MDQPLFARPPEAAPREQIQSAKDRHEEIIEIMRHAPGELAHGFQLLGLEEGLFSLG
jgi:hypothetical protein